MPQSLHTTLPATSSQLSTLMEQEWEQEILRQLPANTEQQARNLGAFERVRHLTCVGDLLRGLLAYVLCTPSFRHLGAWAVLIGLTNISHVAWQKRLRKSRDFLLWLVIQLVARDPIPSSSESTRTVLVDGSRLKKPGGTGDDWRVHLGYDLIAGRLVEVKVSDCHTAEGLTLFCWRAGDIIVADRGYSRRGQVAYAMRCEANVIIRLAVQQFPVLTHQGLPFDVLAWLKRCKSGQHHCQVAFEDDAGCFFGRVIVSSLPEKAAEKARAKERKRALKQQREVKEETLYLCGWLVIFTSLPASRWSDEQVLSLYRARWQVELFIKRLKQLLKLAQLRGKTALTNEATILTLLLAWCLQQSEVQFLRETLTRGAQEWARSHAGKAITESPAKPIVTSEAKAITESPPEPIVTSEAKAITESPTEPIVTSEAKAITESPTEPIVTSEAKAITESPTEPIVTSEAKQGRKRVPKHQGEKSRKSKLPSNPKGAWQETEQGAWQDDEFEQGVIVPTVSSWTITALGVQTLRLFVQGFWTVDRLHECLPFLSRFLCSRRRQRKHQESCIRRHLLAHLLSFSSSA